ncbi:TetR/AcrR family transcriptional regulator [Streptomyces phaeochromogenes]|uniref:TetR/AcrR family transcriptional regulator n=1 Tax=Streptomyces phaeochromogenes TaxID=1923 RepID=UPI0038702EC9|nr:TetR/AcrR family transcriptional regulator [Streptomyces phaeochromogenes]
MQRTRNRVLAVARELLPQVGPSGLTYALLAERADVTRQTLYRHWPTRAALLFDLVLEGPDLGTYPQPGNDVRKVATAWLKSLRAGVSVPAVRTAALAVTTQADHDPDSARALVRISEDRYTGFNQLLEPSGIQISEDEFTLLYGPVLARLFLDRGQVTGSRPSPQEPTPHGERARVKCQADASRSMLTPWPGSYAAVRGSRRNRLRRLADRGLTPIRRTVASRCPRHGHQPGAAPRGRGRGWSSAGPGGP